MPTITQTANANGAWNGTVPFDADTAVTHIVLYAANIDQASAYRRVTQIVNAGPGPNAFFAAPAPYARLFLQTPARPFFLRATRRKGANGPEDDLVSALNPVLPVTPSAFLGWTLGQLLEQDMRPMILVGLDPLTGLFHPLNVITDGGTGFKLKT
jgi:hypothetical protein